MFSWVLTCSFLLILWPFSIFLWYIFYIIFLLIYGAQLLVRTIVKFYCNETVPTWKKTVAWLLLSLSTWKVWLIIVCLLMFYAQVVLVYTWCHYFPSFCLVRIVGIKNNSWRFLSIRIVFTSKYVLICVWARYIVSEEKCIIYLKNTIILDWIQFVFQILFLFRWKENDKFPL